MAKDREEWRNGIYGKFLTLPCDGKMILKTARARERERERETKRERES